MYWWRYKSRGGQYFFGYVTKVGEGLVRMGRYNGDNVGGPVVAVSEIEVLEYKPWE